MNRNREPGTIIRAAADAALRAVGGAKTLDELEDVTITEPMVDDQVLTWDAATSQWINETHAHWLNDISDVTLFSTADGQVLTYEGSTLTWKNKPAAFPFLDDVLDVSLASRQDGQVLTYEAASSVWKNKVLPTIPTNLNGLSDTTIGSLANYDVLSYDTGTSQWVNKPVPLHTQSGTTITSGTVAIARLGTGTPTSSNWLRGDGSFQALPPDEISFQFTSVGNGYYVTTNNCTISLGQEGGTGTLAYNIAPDNSSSFGGAVTLPQALTSGQTLRVVCTGLTGFKAVTLVKT